jgi:hypothetical protein
MKPTRSPFSGSFSDFCTVFLAVLMLLASACTSKKKSDGNSQSSQTSSSNNSQAGNSPTALALSMTTDSAEYVFEGTIGDKARLQGEFSVVRDTIIGFYRYTSAGAYIALSGRFGKDNSFVAEETVTTGPRDNPQEEKTGSFAGTVNRSTGTITGTWTNLRTKKTLPFELRLIAEGKTIRHSRYLAWVSYPAFIHPQLRALNDTIARTIRISYDSCLAEVKRMLNESDADSTSTPSDVNSEWYERMSMTDEIETWYVSPTIVSLRHTLYMDGGGAHGNYTLKCENWFIAPSTGIPQRIHLRDLFKSGDSYIAPLSAYLIKELKNQKASDVVSGYVKDFVKQLREQKLEFTIHPAGLFFHFSPYEVASYVEGTFEVRVPFSVLQEHVKPDGILATLMSPAP